MRRVVSLLFGLVLLSSPCVALATGVTPADPLPTIPMTLGIPTWEELGPPARAFAASVHDTRRNRLLVIGGYADDQRVGTSSVWSLELSRYPYWTRVRPTGPEPSPRWGACAVYDSLRDRVVMFGGVVKCEGSSTFPPDTSVAELWVLTLSGTPTWSRIGGAPYPGSWPPATTDTWPGPRTDATITAGFDTEHAWLLGGSRSYSPYAYGYVLPWWDFWRLDLADLSWHQQPLPPLPGRMSHAAAAAPEVGRIVVHGGMTLGPVDGGLALRDTWAFDPATGHWEDWTQDTLGAPVNVAVGHALVWRPGGNELVRLQGWNEFDDAIWRLNVLTHVWWRDNRSPFEPRLGQSATWDAVHDWVLTTGGDHYGRVRSDTWAVTSPNGLADPVTHVVLPAPLGYNAPPVLDFDPRWRRLLLVEDNTTLWFHDAAAGIWTSSSISGEPPNFVHLANGVVDTTRRRLLVVGGTDSWDMMDSHLDVHALSIDGAPAWSRVSEAAGPPLRSPPLLWNADRTRLLVLSSSSGAGAPVGAWEIVVGDTVRWETRPVRGAPIVPDGMGRAVLDSRRGCAWFLGGGNALDAPQDTLWKVTIGDTVRFERFSPAGRKPLARLLPAMTFDPLRDRLILHGGGDVWSSSMNEAAQPWEATLGDEPVWRSAEPQGDRPSASAALFVDLPDEPQARLEWVHGRLFRVSWELPPPPAAVAESASVMGHIARLVWSGAATDGWAARVERRDANGAWMPIGICTSDHTGRWRFTDTDAPTGELAYRLVYDRLSGPVATGELLVSRIIPATLRIASIRPNPARVPERIEFALPRPSAVTFELIDVTGRRVWSRETAALDAGVYVLPLGLAANPRPGLYWLRVKAGGESANARVAIVR